MQRYSKKREAIITCLKATDTHPTAEWIYMQLKPVFNDLSIGTVYRNLRQLKDDNIIKSVANVNGNERFDFNTSEHPHFICEGCGEVIDLKQDLMSIDKALIDNSENILIKSCEVILKGYCQNCKDKYN